MTMSNEAVVQAWTDALNRHDADAALAWISDDHVFINTGNGQRFIGAAENRKHYTELFELWPEVHFETVKLFGSGEYFVKEWIMTGIHRADAQGLPAAGRSFRVQGAGVGVVRDGKVAEATEYWNFAAFLAQVGLAPAPVG
jgi:steroid delta-isomerase-like uncharacterized protein